MNDLVTIIVPIYNVEKYLERCINSLINQTYCTIEILLIDDGSTDNCGIICDEFALKDKRIKVFHKKNGGLSDARNYGLEKCQGKYITFVDSDDYVSLNYIEILYKSLIMHSSDISICCSQYTDEESFVLGLVSEESCKSISTYQAIVDTLNLKLPQRAWGKLYKRDLFLSIRFPVGKLYEDLAVVYDILLSCETISYTDTQAYYYTIRSGSIMQSEFNIKQSDEIEIIDRAMDRVEQFYPQLINLINARRIYSYFVVLRRVLLSKNPEQYKKLRKDINQKIKNKSRGLMYDPQINNNIKIKLLSYKFGERPYLVLQKIADKRNPETRK